MSIKKEMHMFEYEEEPLPFGVESDDEKKKMQEAYENANERVKKLPICDCPFCKEAERVGGIYEGELSYYCENATEQKHRICNFILYKNNIEKLIRRDIQPDEVKTLCETGSFKATCTKIGGDKTYTGIFSLLTKETYVGLSLSFPERKGE